jgi:hypothetical protein
MYDDPFKVSQVSTRLQPRVLQFDSASRNNMRAPPCVGAVSGQTIFPLSHSSNPAKKGGVHNPLGGVRVVIPGKIR